MKFLTDFWQNNMSVMLLIIVLIIVIPFLFFYLNKAKKEHPKGLIAAALSNMGERFGYYIMNAILLLFLVSKFGLPDATAGLIYSVFYFGIYVLSLVGGIIADRTQNYHRTIQWGLIIMALGYVGMAIPLFSRSADGLIADGTGAWWGILIFTCFALLCIAFGNGLFKGNLQALVGQMYDNFEAEAAKKGPEALAIAKDKRDSGFQIFYVFINIGGVIAPFIAPLLREWWLKAHNFVYNADMSGLCHRYLNGNLIYTDKNGATIDLTQKYLETSQSVVSDPSMLTDQTQFCSDYISVFNQGVHWSFIVSVAAMLISLIVFFTQKKKFPQPAKKVAAETVGYTAEEKAAMAKEIKQRMAALFAVLGIAVFFWLSFHQNGQSLSLFARDFVNSDQIAPEIWQALNPLFVIVLTPLIMGLFASLASKGKPVSTPRKIALGMGIAGCAYLFLMILSIVQNWPSGEEFRAMDAAQMAAAGIAKAGPWVMLVTYFFLTVAELFISPLGLSFVSKVAPRHMVGLCQGLWLGATALGNLMIWLGPVMYNAWGIWKCWGVFLLVCLISMIIMFSMVKWLEHVTDDAPTTEK
jgi:POT family proton-dependent oligopeptide transporter